jgi:hypothetical protein
LSGEECFMGAKKFLVKLVDGTYGWLDAAMEGLPF